ncbi:MAG: NAD-dependent epimerase/dehydratase family protein [Pyrinomonadaceae bacterium]
MSLVTGGSGFLGGLLVDHLRAAGEEVTVLGRRPVEGTKQIVADLARPSLDLGGAEFRTVYHLAGLAHVVPRGRTERELFFQINLEGTRRLLKALERSGRLPEAIVFVSTVAVYGAESGTMLDEATPRRAADPYGASKCAAEDALREWGTKRGVRTGVVRLPLVAGRGAPGNLGAMVRALKSYRYFGVGDGAARRSMVLASDVCRALPEVAKVGGVFHLTDGDHPSFAELEQSLSAALGKKTPRRLPLWLARSGARAGEAWESLSRGRAPLTTRSLTKMTSTLTFCDARARQSFSWNPRRVLDHAAELVA